MDAVHFKGRDVNPWGEYVEAGDLVECRTYFVHYLDKDLLIPELGTVRFHWTEPRTQR